MGKYTEEKIAGYILYFTMKCLGEGIIHVQANQSRMTEDSILKLWVHADGTSSVAYNRGVSNKELKQIQTWVALNYDIIADKWHEKDKTGVWKEK